MVPLVRSLSAPLLSLFFMMMGSGLFNTFTSIRLEIEGVEPEKIGIVTSALYLGILVGSFKMDRWISILGHIRSFGLIAVSLALIVLLQSLWVNPWYWCCLRFGGGICTAGVFIIIESWLLIASPPNQRGGILSIYLAVLYAALSSGQLLINLSDPAGPIPFYITAFLVAFSILPLSIQKITEPKTEKPSAQLNLIALYRISPLGFIGGVVSGIVLAVTYGLVPIYVKESGMSISGIGSFMAVLIFGGFCLQWPIGRLADTGDRRKVINTISFITAALALAIVFVQNIWMLFILAWLFGGFAFTIYPVSMAYACERVKEGEIVAATGGFVLSYGLGAIAGPLAAPIAMDFFGPAGVFYFLFLISLFLGLIGLKKPAPAIADE